MKILIIEDDISMAKVLTSFMQPLKKEFPNAEVTVAHNFEDAKAIIHGIPAPDIALLDLSLPPLRREHTIERLHEIEGRCAIVIVTGHSPDEVKRLLGEKTMEIVHKEPGMLTILFSAMYRAILKFQGKERIDQAYEEAWDRLRALKTLAIPPNGPEE